MALRLYNGTDFDSFLGTPAIAAGSQNLPTAGTWAAGPARTAPNTSNKITGALFFLAQLPTSGDVQVEVRESGVSKVSGIAVNADLKPGFNYIRFGTPYQFTTTAANAYVPYIRKVTATTGSVAQDGSGAIPFIALTTDQTGAPGSTDDVMVGGFHDSGFTPKTFTVTGTGNSWGSGQNKAITLSNRLLYMATLPFNGGTVKFDTTADVTLTQYGNVWASAGGVFDMRPGPSSVSKLVFTNDADGDFSLGTFSSTYGGQILTTGKAVAVSADYVSGLGTAASPAVFAAAHGFSVGDELVIGWGSDYLKNEVRFVISVPNPDEVVWSSTKAGSETALAHTHAPGFPVANLTRNSIITNSNNARGFSVYNASPVGVACDFSYTRFEYANCLSSRGLQLSSSAAVTPADGMVAYNNSASGRTSVSWQGNVPETISDVTMYNTKGSNFSAQSGFAVTGARKTVRNLLHYAEPGSSTNCAGLSISSSATGCVIDGFFSSGANAGNSAGGYALGVFGSGHTFNRVVIDAARRCAVRLGSAQEVEFTNSLFGTVASNTADVLLDTGVFAKARFLSSSFGSPTLLSDYLTALSGTDIAFQDMDGNTGKHRWFTHNASFWSSGAGLPDTTTRTPGSLALAIKPQDATDGGQLTLKVPASPASQVLFYGYLYRNATFSSGDITVELFLPGTLTTGTPDASYTLPTTTGAWLPFVVSAYNPATVARYAKVRITAKTATPGAYVFLDDIFDAQTGNKVAGLDLWDDGHISPIVVAADYSSIPEQTRQAVWGDQDTYTVGSKGRSLADTEQNTDVTQAKVDML